MIKYPLSNNIIDESDIDALCSWLKTNPRLTIGPLTDIFETKWSEWIDMKYSVYVNSGSSANLLALYALIQKGTLSKGDKVVVPSVSWATDLAPVMQLGLEPILCDCNLDDLSLQLDEFEYICKIHQPKAVMFVSVLGLVPNMDRVMSLCNEYNVSLIEDTCESLGSQCKGKKLGSFGCMSTFSLYFGHHISTIEGGMISTNDKALYEILKSIRSHGWDRGLSKDTQTKLRKEWDTGEFEALYTFYYPGFNMRATDLQAFLGIRQLKKLDKVIENRHSNFLKYIDEISDSVWKPNINSDNLVSNFCYPIISKDRQQAIIQLQKHGVETRPLIAGSMAKQPFYKKEYGYQLLPNSEIVHNYGFYLPNNQDLTQSQVKEICNIVNKSLVKKLLVP
jgi:CDP-6-deoxy-D-xylo-4-hexulose-3-dehydrase